MGWAQPNLTAETRDRIARTLFVVRQDDGDWLNGLCPFHDDRTMSFGQRDGRRLQVLCGLHGLRRPR
ncbi:MAG: hypothetical protein ACLR7Z_10600 [Bilophila wadsworthia]